MLTKEIRQKFLDYFKQHNHEVVKSSSLVPTNDPTLLFTNAGMNQFKDVFLGNEALPYVRATSAQKCVRAGGKHNDLENVGYTARHHTFFEMLGNFSFGDYFKKDAIRFAWDFLTNILKIPSQKLYITVYDADDESYHIWLDIIGISKERIIKIGDKPYGEGSDNFWQMADTGPCGPCTEIFYDHGEKVLGSLPGTNSQDGDRYVEIWNCVFMEYNRDSNGELHPLPKPSVDTGMGLERIAAVIQNVHSNYEIDIFKALISKLAAVVSCKDLINPSLKVLADHIRSISFLIADGVIPSNEGRGYVLRRIIRRAVRHGYKLNMRQSFLYKLIDTLIQEMGDTYPELITHKKHIESTIQTEEDKFYQTIDNGMKLLENTLSSFKKDDILPGDIGFKLYDTCGFPIDLTVDICREFHVSVDMDEFNRLMNEQKLRGKSNSKFKINNTYKYDGSPTVFEGYDTPHTTAQIVALFDKNNQPVKTLNETENGVIVLNKTVCYPEGGGQVGDTGIIYNTNTKDRIFTVDNTQKIKKDVIGHIGIVSGGCLEIGDEVRVEYDIAKREATKRNHSATHLLHKALHEVFGIGATQKGSYVCSEYTRFDFAHNMPLTEEQIQKIEAIVNHAIMTNYPITSQDMKYIDAIENNVTALFGEKYHDNVRVISMGDFSKELCGGTHAAHAGDIGLFTIISETGVSNGVRRIEAITGDISIKRMQTNLRILNSLRNTFKAQSNDIILDKVRASNDENKKIREKLLSLKGKFAIIYAKTILKNVVTIKEDLQLLITTLNDTDTLTANATLNALYDQIHSGIIILAFTENKAACLLVSVTPSLIKTYQANTILNTLLKTLGGKGGGKVDFAKSGGGDIVKLDETLKKAHELFS